MTIKLLKKSDIQAQKNVEKRIEIDQGKQLAERIDRLREVAAQEERSLAEFRSKTVASINAEITTLTEQVSGLKRELQSMMEDRELGMTKVYALEKEASDNLHNAQLKNARADKALFELEDKQKALIKAEKELAKRQKQLETLEKQAQNDTTEAQNLLVSAKETANQTANISNAAHELRDRVSSELYDKDVELAARERAVTYRTESLNAREQELNDRERAINDKYNALLQAQKHLQHGNTSSL